MIRNGIRSKTDVKIYNVWEGKPCFRFMHNLEMIIKIGNIWRGYSFFTRTGTMNRFTFVEISAKNHAPKYYMTIQHLGGGGV